jgi:Xaa-Pro aminopeptidase
MTPEEDMNGDRIAKVREVLEKRKLGGLLVTDIINIGYLTGFTGSTAVALVTDDKAVVLVDPRYTIQASEEVKNFEVREYTGKSTTEAVAELVKELKIAKLGFEADEMTVERHRALKRELGTDVKLSPTTGIISTIRYVKDEGEIELTRKAVEIVDKTYDYILTFIKPGMKEIDVALEIDFYMRKLGASGPGFDTIVAAGPHAALPHAQPGDRLIKKGQFLKMDYGASYRQYNSDITRTVAIGSADEKMKKVYHTVLDAQLAAIAAIRPGKTGVEIDAVARDVITEAGYGDCFGHGLGHSIGRLVHDGPGFSKLSKVVLEPGMIFTVEPGIYIEGWGGVRIEDDIVVTDDGCEILNTASKELKII